MMLQHGPQLCGILQLLRHALDPLDPLVHPVQKELSGLPADVRIAACKIGIPKYHGAVDAKRKVSSQSVIA